MDNKKGELDMKCEQLDITLEGRTYITRLLALHSWTVLYNHQKDCYNKNQSENNVHLVLCFDDESSKLAPRIKVETPLIEQILTRFQESSKCTTGEHSLLDLGLGGRARL